MTPAKPVQIPLGFTWRPAFGRADFLVAPSNAQALSTLENWQSWSDPILLLTGPEGSGKSHLVQLWCDSAQAQCAGPASLDFSRSSTLIDCAPVAIDDADRIADEEVLFHLINTAREKGHALLLTARRAPPLWKPRLPDLESRLAGLNKAALAAPDENLLAALLVKLFADRQLQLEPKLIEAIVVRIDRSFGAARRFVAALDEASLAARKPVSMALIREVLAHDIESL